MSALIQKVEPKSFRLTSHVGEDYDFSWNFKIGEMYYDPYFDDEKSRNEAIREVRKILIKRRIVGFFRKLWPFQKVLVCQYCGINSKESVIHEFSCFRDDYSMEYITACPSCVVEEGKRRGAKFDPEDLLGIKKELKNE